MTTTMTRTKLIHHFTAAPVIAAVIIVAMVINLTGCAGRGRGLNSAVLPGADSANDTAGITVSGPLQAFLEAEISAIPFGRGSLYRVKAAENSQLKNFQIQPGTAGSTVGSTAGSTAGLDQQPAYGFAAGEFLPLLVRTETDQLLGGLLPVNSMGLTSSAVKIELYLQTGTSLTGKFRRRLLQPPLQPPQLQSTTESESYPEGFFIMGSLAVEFEYAFNNREEFNRLLSQQLSKVEFDLNLINLFLKLPGQTDLIDARTGTAVSGNAREYVLGSVNYLYNENNPAGRELYSELQLALNEFNRAYESTVDSVIEINLLTAELALEDSSQSETEYDRLWDQLSTEINKFDSASRAMVLAEEQLQSILASETATGDEATAVPGIRPAILIIPAVKVALMAATFTGFASFLAEKQQIGQQYRQQREQALIDFSDSEQDPEEVQTRYDEANSNYQQVGNEVIQEVVTKVTVDLISAGSPVSNDSLAGILLNETVKNKLESKVKNITSVNQSGQIVISEIRSDGSFYVAPGESTFLVSGGRYARETFEFDSELSEGSQLDGFSFTPKTIDEIQPDQIDPADPTDPTDPTDPGDDPTDPTDPTDPGDDPTEPADPPVEPEIEQLDFNYNQPSTAGTVEEALRFAQEVESFLNHGSAFSRQAKRIAPSGTDLVTDGTVSLGGSYVFSQSQYFDAYVKTGTSILHGPATIYLDSQKQQVAARLYYQDGYLEGVQEGWEIFNGKICQTREYFYIKGKREGVQRTNIPQMINDEPVNVIEFEEYSDDLTAAGVKLTAYGIGNQLIPSRVSSLKIDGFNLEWREIEDQNPAAGVYLFSINPSLYNVPTGERRLSASFYSSENLEQQYYWIKKNNQTIKDGPWKSCYDDSENTIRAEGEYLSGAKHGVWKEWYSSGSLTAVTVWNNDLRDGRAEYYYESGNLKTETMYSSGKRDGIYREYYDQPDLLMTDGTYTENSRSGTWTYYRPDGTVELVTEY